MMDQANQKRLMVQYLYGELSPDERAGLEDLYLQDSGVFQELVALEYEIVDQYILGELSQGERKRFESSFLANPARRDAVDTARSLLAYSAAVESTLSSQSFELRGKARNSSRVTQIAAALLLVMVGLTSWLIVSNRRMASSLERLRREQAAAIQNSKALQQQIDSLRADLQQRETTINADSQLPNDIAVVSLGPGISRGAGEPVTLVIPDRSVYVLLRVVMTASCSHCNLSVRTVEGDLIWKTNNIHGISTFDNAQEIAVSLPSRLLRNGDYVLRITAGREDLPHMLVGYSFRVIRR
jgi:hypothetical protein